MTNIWEQNIREWYEKSLMQQIEDRFTYDSGIPFDEMAEIQANLTEEEDNAIEQAIVFEVSERVSRIALFLIIGLSTS